MILIREAYDEMLRADEYGRLSSPSRPHINCLSVPTLVENLGGDIAKAAGQRGQLFLW